MADGLAEGEAATMLAARMKLNMALVRRPALVG